MTPEEIITEMNWTYDSDPSRYAMWCNLIRPAMINHAAAVTAEKDAIIADLQSWKESAKDIINCLDLQEIGKELKLPAGADISINILPAIKAYKKQIEDLEARLKTLRENFNEVMKND